MSRETASRFPNEAMSKQGPGILQGWAFYALLRRAICSMQLTPLLCSRAHSRDISFPYLLPNTFSSASRLDACYLGLKRTTNTEHCDDAAHAAAIRPQTLL